MNFRGASVRVVIWDAGTYSLLEDDDPVKALESGKIVMELNGKILKKGGVHIGQNERTW